MGPAAAVGEAGEEQADDVKVGTEGRRGACGRLGCVYGVCESERACV